jgi:hypothetical protein
LAAVLAFLVPGAGHFYQGRYFKALIYSICILGAFFYGMHMAEWQAVYRSAERGKRNLGFYAQVGTGLPALYAIVQTNRYQKQGRQPVKSLTGPLATSFQGTLVDPRIPNSEQAVSGQLSLEPSQKPASAITGTFRGTDGQGNEVSLQLGGKFEMAPEVGGNPERALLCGVVEQQGNEVGADGTLIRGTVPRKFLNWFEAPLEDDEIQELNRKLGKRYELALVYTWIAGLLNILAVWDALEGPAYGYGDEDEEESEREKKKRDKPKEQPERKLEATAKP